MRPIIERECHLTVERCGVGRREAAAAFPPHPARVMLLE